MIKSCIIFANNCKLNEAAAHRLLCYPPPTDKCILNGRSGFINVTR